MPLGPLNTPESAVDAIEPVSAALRPIEEPTSRLSDLLNCYGGLMSRFEEARRLALKYKEMLARKSREALDAQAQLERFERAITEIEDPYLILKALYGAGMIVSSKLDPTEQADGPRANYVVTIRSRSPYSPSWRRDLQTLIANKASEMP